VQVDSAFTISNDQKARLILSTVTPEILYFKYDLIAQLNADNSSQDRHKGFASWVAWANAANHETC
jgi:hypothetical protein